MKTRTILIGAALIACGSVEAADPSVTTATLSYDSATRVAFVDYTLANGPAVITVEFRTNGVALAEKTFSNVEGDVNRLVSGDTTHRIRWQPPTRMLNAQLPNLTAVVTAWPTTKPPLYMVVDCALSDSLGAVVRYYTSTNALPGGLLENPVYRLSSLVLRRIDASGVTWSFGSGDGAFDVTLADDFYIGVFELTQGQCLCLTGDYPGSSFSSSVWRDMRPVENVQYGGHVRGYDGAYWPDPPSATRILGKARDRTGVDFDLPGEAQWEFACRAGNPADKLNDGSAITDANKNRLARYQTNGGYVGGQKPAYDVAPDVGGTAIVGSYAPNSWGLYDTLGNVWEWCLDWYQEGAAFKNLAGAVNSRADGKTVNGSDASAAGRLRRGGGWDTSSFAVDATSRYKTTQYSSSDNLGLRLVCPCLAK